MSTLIILDKDLIDLDFFEFYECRGEWYLDEEGNLLPEYSDNELCDIEADWYQEVGEAIAKAINSFCPFAVRYSHYTREEEIALLLDEEWGIEDVLIYNYRHTEFASGYLLGPYFDDYLAAIIRHSYDENWQHSEDLQMYVYYTLN